VQCSAARIALNCGAVQCSAVQCSAVQCSPYSAELWRGFAFQPSIHCSIVLIQCSAVQCSAVQCSEVQCNIVPYSAVHTRPWPRHDWTYIPRCLATTFTPIVLKNQSIICHNGNTTFASIMCALAQCAVLFKPLPQYSIGGASIKGRGAGAESEGGKFGRKI
jgi:hypothetical protein